MPAVAKSREGESECCKASSRGWGAQGAAEAERALLGVHPDCRDLELQGLHDGPHRHLHRGAGAEQGDSSDNWGGGGEGPRPSSLIAIGKASWLQALLSLFFKPTYYIALNIILSNEDTHAILLRNHMTEFFKFSRWSSTRSTAVLHLSKSKVLEYES